MSSYVCVKCGGTDCEVAELRGAGGLMSSVLDVSTRKFKTVSCERCGYTEFYRADLSDGAKLFDFLAG
ncbi:zinc ribbon domain-containing protein [Lysobacter silvisoli]|uniref:GTP-binding protein n=1 Tax=Lysobacter silvisoli TaxID=2293254 RepID=A0A371K5F3_9GAMM|nr:zinc ribbon domain-containing protein [Lysobacter silvisoli]RDZ29171.1 GTP-binding protein [Lysobacter silvisoli]